MITSHQNYYDVLDSNGDVEQQFYQFDNMFCGTHSTLYDGFGDNNEIMTFPALVFSFAKHLRYIPAKRSCHLLAVLAICASQSPQLGNELFLLNQKHLSDVFRTHASSPQTNCRILSTLSNIATISCSWSAVLDLRTSIGQMLDRQTLMLYLAEQLIFVRNALSEKDAKVIEDSISKLVEAGSGENCVFTSGIIPSKCDPIPRKDPFVFGYRGKYCCSKDYGDRYYNEHRNIFHENDMNSTYDAVFVTRCLSLMRRIALRSPCLGRGHKAWRFCSPLASYNFVEKFRNVAFRNISASLAVNGNIVYPFVLPTWATDMAQPSAVSSATSFVSRQPIVLDIHMVTKTFFANITDMCDNPFIANMKVRRSNAVVYPGRAVASAAGVLSLIKELFLWLHLVSGYTDNGDKIACKRRNCGSIATEEFLDGTIGNSLDENTEDADAWSMWLGAGWLMPPWPRIPQLRIYAGDNKQYISRRRSFCDTVWNDIDLISSEGRYHAIMRVSICAVAGKIGQCNTDSLNTANNTTADPHAMIVELVWSLAIAVSVTEALVRRLHYCRFRGRKTMLLLTAAVDRLLLLRDTSAVVRTGLKPSTLSVAEENLTEITGKIHPEQINKKRCNVEKDCCNQGNSNIFVDMSTILDGNRNKASTNSMFESSLGSFHNEFLMDDGDEKTKFAVQTLNHTFSGTKRKLERNEKHIHLNDNNMDDNGIYNHSEQHLHEGQRTRYFKSREKDLKESQKVPGVPKVLP